MNRAEIKKLLEAASARDNRKINDERIHAWLQDLGDLPYGLAEAALRWHYLHSTEYLMAAHIRRNAAFLQHADRRARRLRHEAEAAAVERAARDTRPLRDRSPEVQALVRATAARLTTPASLAINARWRTRRVSGGPRSAEPIPTIAPAADRGPNLDHHEMAARESQAVQALHKAGRPCGTSTCCVPECRLQRQRR